MRLDGEMIKELTMEEESRKEKRTELRINDSPNDNMPVANKSSIIDVFAMDDDSEYESEGEGGEAITGIKRKIDVELSEYKKMARLEMREIETDGSLIVVEI
jgi:hypothetical protein